MTKRKTPAVVVDELIGGPPFGCEPRMNVRDMFCQVAECGGLVRRCDTRD
jgi:hypothetical protein